MGKFASDLVLGGPPVKEEEEEAGPLVASEIVFIRSISTSPSFLPPSPSFVFSFSCNCLISSSLLSLSLSLSDGLLSSASP